MSRKTMATATVQSCTRDKKLIYTLKKIMQNVTEWRNVGIVALQTVEESGQ